MQDPHTGYLAGLDGGGTGCRAAVADATGAVLGRASGGPANIATDPDAARANIVAALGAAWRDAGLAGHPAPAACAIGVAGANIGDFAMRLRDSLPYARCLVTDDRATSLLGALGEPGGADSDGCIAVIGTGSFFSSRRGGVETAIGGWGFQIGDDGSGARLGQRLLRRVIHCHDGFLPHSDLTRAVLRGFDDAPENMSEFALRARPNDFARFAAQVVEAARAGDKGGAALVARSIAEIQAAIDCTGFREGDRLCMEGGLGRALADFLAPRYAGSLAPPRGDALSGAIAMARRLARAPRADPGAMGGAP